MTKLKELGGRIYEAKKDNTGRLTFPVVIISQGLGNLGDKNYYTKEAIQSGPSVYEGKKAYYNHPTPTQEEEQPGRDVCELCGHYEDVQAVAGEKGLYDLKATFVPMATETKAIGLIQHSVEYKKKYPNDDQNFVGISINGDGEGLQMEWDEFLKEIKPNSFEMDKLKQIEGSKINVITKFTDATSADIVTEAGARGRILKESKKRRKTMFEAMINFLKGAEKGDKKVMEAAAKDMLQNEGEDEARKKEAEAEEAYNKEAEAMAKGLLNAKKEMKKYDGESESEYEARVMKSVMKKKREDEDEAKKKEAEKKAEDEKKKEQDEKSKEKNEDDEKKEAKKKSEDEDDDGDADDEPMAKLKKKNEKLQKEVEKLKKEKKEAEDEAEKRHKESATAQVELEAKKRADGIDEMLAKSGLPRYATNPLRELFVSKVKSEEEMKKMIEVAKEVHTKGIESRFYVESSVGFPETQPADGKPVNDDLFE